MTSSIPASAALFLALLAASPASGPAAEPPSLKPEAPAKTPASEPTAGEKFKNIKLLRSMPASQMLPVMHLMRSALNVTCDYCHVTEGNQYELDTKREKETARRMIQMTMDLNKNSFEGRTVVTCNTCHGGREHPVSVPPIGQGLFADTTRAAAEPEEKMPAPAQILDRYIEALGGKAALLAVKSRVSRGTLLKAKLIDGGTPKAPKARIVNRGQEEPLEIVQKAADLHGDLDLRERADKMRVSAKDKIDGREVYVVRATNPEGNRESLFFDVQTGLLRRRITLRPTVLGSDPEQTDYEDYRAVGGVKVPFLVKVSYLDDNHLGITRKLKEIRDNVD